MARNRKRAKERRARRPTNGAQARTATAGGYEAPNPLDHATPDVELAEEQLEVGRPEQPEQPEPGAEAELNEQELEREELDSEQQDLDPIQRAEIEEMEEDEEEESARAAEKMVRADSGLPAGREHHRNRLINFLQGSWRELQRVQWPDRRQVIQATGVVIGFVIVAGVFLGVADFLAGKIMNYILTGHFK